MAGYPGNFTRVTRVGLDKTSGWAPLAYSAFFTPSPPNQAANTFNDLTSSASGAHTVGTGAATLDAATSTASGGVGASGTSAATLATIVSTASGSTVTGTSGVTLAAITSTATGGSTHGTSAVTLAAITTAGTGTAAGGSSAGTRSLLTSTASGARGASGTSAVTLAAITSASTGTAAGGSAATTLADLTGVGTDAAPPVAIIFDDGTIPARFYWSPFGPGSVVDRPDGTGGTSKALQFPDIDDDEETYFEIYVNAREGNNSLTVRYEVSSEEGYDFLRVLVDGVDVLGDPDVDPGDEEGRSGITGGWEEFTVPLAVGARLIRFGYYKDGSADDGDDTAWLSKIIAPALAERPVTASVTLEALTSSASGTTPTYPGLYRFWRIAALATHSVSGSTGLGEVELRGSLGGADLTDTLPGVASTQYGGGDDPSVCFDNNTANYWQANVEYGGLIWEFTTYPQDVQQVYIQEGEMLDIQIAASTDGVFWDWKAIQRGNTEYVSYFTPTPLTVDLVGPNRHYDGYLGINDLGQTDVYPIYCESDHIAVTQHTTWEPIRIEKLVAHSASTYPQPPIGENTYTFFVKGVIYSDAGGYPGTLIAETAERTDAPNRQWFDLGLTDWVFLMPGTYWFGVHTGGTSGNLVTNNTFGPQTTRTVPYTYTSGVPASFPVGGVPLASGRPQPIYAVFPISTGEATFDALTSDAVGTFGVLAPDPDPITAEPAALVLGELLSAASGTVTHPAPRLRRVSLIGYDRRTVTLHGTVRHL